MKVTVIGCGAATLDNLAKCPEQLNWTSGFLQTEEDCKTEAIKQAYLVTEMEEYEKKKQAYLEEYEKKIEEYEKKIIPKKLQKRFAKEQCKKGWKR